MVFYENAGMDFSTYFGMMDAEKRSTPWEILFDQGPLGEMVELESEDCEIL